MIIILSSQLIRSQFLAFLDKTRNIFHYPSLLPFFSLFLKMLAKVALLLLPLLASAAATPVSPKAGIVARGDRKWEFLDTRKGKNPVYTIGEERTKSPPKAELIRTHGVRSGGSSRDPAALHDNDWNDPNAYNAANDRVSDLSRGTPKMILCYFKRLY